MKLWIDECLSPALVQISQHRYETTCNKYRGKLGVRDPILYRTVTDEGFVFVTNNERDFLSLTRYTGVHPGLVVLPALTREGQRAAYAAVLQHIELESEHAGAAPAAWMVNRLVEHDADSGAVSDTIWPPEQ